MGLHARRLACSQGATPRRAEPHQTWRSCASISPQMTVANGCRGRDPKGPETVQVEREATQNVQETGLASCLLVTRLSNGVSAMAEDGCEADRENPAKSGTHLGGDAVSYPIVGALQDDKGPSLVLGKTRHPCSAH